MTDTSVSVLDDKPQRSIAKPADKKPPSKVQGKVKAALDKMVWEGLPWDDAAREVGFTVQSMRSALQRSHVLAYLRSEREILRATITPMNIHRLREIRDAGDNMPAVQAIKLLEQMDETTNNRAGSGASQVPGFTIVLNVQGNITGSHTEQQRETGAKPLILHAADRLTESVDR